MNWDWTTFLVGIFVGANVGLFLGGLLNATRDEHDRSH